jgi:hypothetical protein
MGGLHGGPHELVGALKVALLAPEMSKMSKNDHNREKIHKTHQNRYISSVFGLISQSEDGIRG